MTPHLTRALLLATSVHFAPAPTGCDEAQPKPSFRIVTPSEPGGSVDVLWPQAGSLPSPQADDAVQQRLVSAFRVYVEAVGAASPMAGRYEILADRLRDSPFERESSMPFQSMRTAFLSQRRPHGRPQRRLTLPSRSRQPNMRLLASSRSSERSTVCLPTCFASRSISPHRWRRAMSTGISLSFEPTVRSCRRRS
jgi:hypothetical protein